jgi:hypothetical protein
MHAQDWIGLAVLILGGGGVSYGGNKLTAKITALVVGIENLVKAVEAVRLDVKDVVGTVQDHSVTLAQHGEQISALQKP